MKIFVVLTLLSVVAALCSETSAIEAPALVQREFIFESAPFRSCHASTIVETPSGLVAAWFGGSDEGNNDVTIWLSRREGNRWTAPNQVASGAEEDKREPCWNPVLFRYPDGPLLLFYKVGPNPRQWWGMVMKSIDDGRTWGEARRLPDGTLGPIKNKPVLLPEGVLLCPSSTEHDGWRVQIERTSDQGKTWTKSAVAGDPMKLGAIQPAVLSWPEGKLQIVCRHQQHGNILQSWSTDRGQTWTELTPTELPNPNSGIDAVSMTDGRAAMVYNHTRSGRSPLNVAVGFDDGSWHAAVVLEDSLGEFSYPAIIQTDDGLLHITYTWQRRRIRHVVLDPKNFELRRIETGHWPG
jgi:predicted neuraminidase